MVQYDTAAGTCPQHDDSAVFHVLQSAQNSFRLGSALAVIRNYYILADTFAE